MDLPASIEGTSDRDPLPHALREKSETVRREGGPQSIEELIIAIRQLATEATNSLNQAFQVLDQEEEGDNKLRAQFLGKWNRAHSHALTASLRQEGAKLRTNLEHAEKSNSYVIQKFDVHRPAIEGLALSEAELQRILPAIEELPPEAAEAAEALRECLGYLDSCIAERRKLEAELKQLSQNVGIFRVLVCYTLRRHR